MKTRDLSYLRLHWLTKTQGSQTHIYQIPEEGSFADLGYVSLNFSY